MDGELRGDHFHFRFRLTEGHTRFEPAVNRDPMPTASIVCSLMRSKRHRRPDIDFAGGAESVGRHTDDLIRLAVYLDRPTDDIAGTTENALPESVAQDDDVIFSGRVFFRQQHPAEHRFHAIHVEVMRGRRYADEALRLAFAGQVQGRARGSRQVFIRFRLLFPIDVVRR